MERRITTCTKDYQAASSSFKTAVPGFHLKTPDPGDKMSIFNLQSRKESEGLHQKVSELLVRNIGSCSCSFLSASNLEWNSM